MTDVDTQKLGALRDLILDKAEAEVMRITQKAQREADEWLSQELVKIDQEADLIINDARRRAEEIRRRELLAAEREVSREKLRLQNRLITQAKAVFLDELVALRSREDHWMILLGLLLEAQEALVDLKKGSLRLAAIDSPLGERIVSRSKELRPQIDMRFDSTPAPILGGLWLIDDMGNRQVNSDWQTKVVEMSDTLTERLMAIWQ
ncbi:V/A-type H+-transporting ATPase subunit E [Acetomicrobium thermoterrenum DSM 13490]|uniref:V/A-type H+-transporting ATPase subunit E n=1 Tax=Acetomicrobium thermoterrenum DSM 13490 TaxID=1120987 RepID=A0A1H3FZW1_9BACT|nr:MULTISPECIES: ATPase [Acetomicrobium]SDX96440.1 V/A-type H+-transporting ATPase subunit E [Acetomicrobium thermoterrenum DSM 13490]